ncbi:MAG: YHS domain-containing protein [Thermoleophilia bacterium]|nr:YHS domain-containing protein [Thermoleophilia bacterium]
MTLDPVCGLELRERKAEAATFYKGRAFYFCSQEHRDAFEANPEGYASRVSSGPLTVGVMGAASGDLPEAVRRKAFELGQAVAEMGMVLITGAAPGLPWESARGAQSNKGLSVGISPALSLDEHVNVYDSPADHFDVMIYTGSGLMGREIVNIRSSDMVIVIGGHSGTLGEFAIAYDEGKLIGVVDGSGGIADAIPNLVEAIDKETGAAILYHPEPAVLLRRMVQTFVYSHFQRPSVFARNGGDGSRRPAG